MARKTRALMPTLPSLSIQLAQRIDYWTAVIRPMSTAQKAIFVREVQNLSEMMEVEQIKGGLGRC